MNKIIYLVPFDKTYFLLGTNLIQSMLDSGIDPNKIYVVDYGLEASHLSFLKEIRVNILNIPKYLQGSHPYKLKSHLHDYLTENSINRDYLVQLDADMILLKNPEASLNSIIDVMQSQSRNIALCPDVGVANLENGEYGRSIKNFTEQYSCPIFSKLLPENSQDALYLNTGFVIYSPDFDLKNFQQVADSMIGEVVWEQNAINLIYSIHPHEVSVLNPQIWNLHGKLLEIYDTSLDSFFIHITSPTPNSIRTGLINLHIDGSELTPFYMRQSTNNSVFQIQNVMLGKLLDKNRDLFVEYFTNKQSR